MSDKGYISLAHGNGGSYMRELVDNLFVRYLANPLLDTDADAAHIPISGGDVMITTDGFTVQPLEFPGGTIGSLAVHGTVNDLAVSGAKPLYLCLNAFIEEGFSISLLERIIISLAQAASDAGVRVVTGDTKVVRRGEGGGLYLCMTGVGLRSPEIRLGMKHICAGDALLVSGPVGDHGIAVLLAREQFGLSGTLSSDAGNVYPLAQSLFDFSGLRFMRDPTRGGLGTVAHEISRATGLTVRLNEPSIPVRETVRTVCDMLGYDPMFLACEGRILAVVEASQAESALAIWRNTPGGEGSAWIGHLEQGEPQVIMETELGGMRLLEELGDDPLPRIC